MHVLSDNTDPFYTSLEEGAYAKVKPDGMPCDSAIKEGCSPPGMSKNGKIAMAVVLTVVCLFVIGLSAYWIHLVQKNRRSNY